MLKQKFYSQKERIEKKHVLQTAWKILVKIGGLRYMGLQSSRITTYSESESRNYFQSAKDDNLDGVISALEKRADPFFRNQNAWCEPIAGLYAKVINRDDLPRGTTALHLAANKGHNKVVAYLLENYPKLISTLNSDGETALFWAKDNCVKLLLAHKINVFVKTKKPNFLNIFQYPDMGYNALFTHIFAPCPEGVEAILQYIHSSCPQRIETQNVLKKHLLPDIIGVVNGYIISLPKEDIIIPTTIMRVVTLRRESKEIREIFKAIKTITAWNPGEWTQTICKREGLAPVMWVDSEKIGK